MNEDHYRRGRSATFFGAMALVLLALMGQLLHWPRVMSSGSSIWIPTLIAVAILVIVDASNIIHGTTSRCILVERLSAILCATGAYVTALPSLEGPIPCPLYIAGCVLLMARLRSAHLLSTLPAKIYAGCLCFVLLISLGEYVG